MDGRRRTQNISLQPVEWLALRRLAEREERGNISAAVARLLDAAMRERIGRDWKAAVEAESLEVVPA
jgi:hypothetical protein